MGTKKPAVTVKGQGAFTGQTDPVEYTITGAVLTDDAEMTATSVVWQNKSGICKPVVTVTDKYSHQILKAGTDYQKVVKYTYTETTDVTVKGSTAPISRAAGEEVNKTDIIPAGTKITATITGMNRYSGTLSTVFRFIDKSYDLSSATITIRPQVYKGRKIVLTQEDVTFKINGEDKALTLGTDYEIVYDEKSDYSNKGKYKVTIRAVAGNPSGYANGKTVNFNITTKPLN